MEAELVDARSEKLTQDLQGFRVALQLIGGSTVFDLKADGDDFAEFGDVVSAHALRLGAIGAKLGGIAADFEFAGEIEIKFLVRLSVVLVLILYCEEIRESEEETRSSSRGRHRGTSCRFS